MSSTSSVDGAALETRSANLPGPRSTARPLRWLRSRLVLRVAAGLLLFGLWQILVSAFAADFVARPSRMVSRIPDVLGNEEFLRSAGSTIVAIIEGVAIAVVIGTLLGLLIGRLRDVDAFTRFYVNSFYAMPLVALIPLVTLWLGYTPGARLAVIVLEATLPIIFNVAAGARSVPRDYIDVARAYRARWWNVWFGITFAASLPYLLAGFTLAVGRALVGAVTAEYLTSVPGLGYYILFNSRTFHQDDAAIAALVLAAVGTLIYGATGGLTRRALPWYQRG